MFRTLVLRVLGVQKERSVGAVYAGYEVYIFHLCTVSIASTNILYEQKQTIMDGSTSGSWGKYEYRLGVGSWNNISQEYGQYVGSIYCNRTTPSNYGFNNLDTLSTSIISDDYNAGWVVLWELCTV